MVVACVDFCFSVIAFQDEMKADEMDANKEKRKEWLDQQKKWPDQQKKLASTKSSATQTTVWDTDIEKALTKMNEDMEEFHARLERVEQARLEFINLRRLSGNLESPSKEGVAPASEQWSGAAPTYPAF